MTFFSFLPFYTLPAIVVLGITVSLHSKWEQRRRNEQEAIRRGCGPAPRMPRKGFLGFGNLLKGLAASRDDRHPQHVVEAFDTELGRDVHTVVVPIVDYELIVSRDPANIQAVFATQSADWDVSEFRADSMRLLFGHGIFTSRGEYWKTSRALIRPQFATDQVNDLDLFERHVQHLLAAIHKHHHAGKSQTGWTRAFDLQPLFYNLALDVMTEMLYGYSVHSQDPSERVELPVLPGFESPDRENIGMHMDAGKAGVETRSALWKYRWLLPSGRFLKHCAAVHKYAEWFVELRLRRGDSYLDDLQTHQAGKATSERFVLLHELAKVNQDPVDLRSQTLNVLSAGRDTTAALLSWVVYYLARHRSVWDKLRAEVLDRFGPYKPDEPVGIEFRMVRDSMPYMTAVINETLRVAPVVPLNERVSLRDTTLPRGGGPKKDQPVFVPAGTQILIPTYALGMRPDIWGDDFQEFKPERWINNHVGRKTGFEFVPFGGGVRQCIGQQLARLKTAYILIRLIQRFDRVYNAEVPADARTRFHHTIENRSGSGVQIKLRYAQWEPKPREPGSRAEEHLT
ncbi:cytochrome P450 [Parathielavia appendiculata]|uniref:Cytochrome P450 n=1 Tax=Parathielavia appendiculata TaxID=2587402 RepID=A0AAN6TWK6_9PEZI|nr:cytochrome P450 [Parathielavia appendiculata]